MKNEKLKASITVETALVMPLFIITIMFFCYFYNFMQLQIKVQKAINNAANDLAAYGYVLNRAEAASDEKRKELFSNIPYADKLYEYLLNYTDDYVIKFVTYQYLDKDELIKYRVIDGYKGFSFKDSELHDSDNCIVIKVSYQVDLPYFSKILTPLTVNQTAAAGLFSGHLAGSSETEDSQVVYVTKNGEVYHTSLFCTHLKLDTSEVASSSVKDLRNHNGGKYSGCTICTNKKQMPDTVFVTSEGSRYHYNDDCVGLRRTVYLKKLSDINLPLCQRCKAREENDFE